MDIKKIQEKLQAKFNLTPEYPKTRHIIFWYDQGGGFKEALNQLELNNVKVVYLEKGKERRDNEISTNVFELKYELEVLDKESNFLIYSEYPKPEDERNNFLLDIELYSDYFKANKTSMIIEEYNFDRFNNELEGTIKKYESFFGNKERKERLKKLLEDIDSRMVTEEELKLGMLASLSNSKLLNIEEILNNIIIDRSKLDLIDKWMGIDELYEFINKKYDLKINSFDSFLKVLLVVHFLRSISKKEINRNIENYYLGDKPKIYIYTEQLLNNKLTEKIIKQEFYQLGRDLKIIEQINQLSLDEAVNGISFEAFDSYIIEEIVTMITKSHDNIEKYKGYINKRLDKTLWFEKYNYLYKALLNGINYFESIEKLEIKEREDAREVVRDYMSSYYKIDTYYRNFYYSYDKIQDLDISKLFEGLSKKISLAYSDVYQENLSKEWIKNIEKNKYLPMQRDFYINHVKRTDARVAVVISDALRYEVGVELAERLKIEEISKEIKLEGMVTELPSITSLGMANLLPHNDKIEYDITNSKVMIDGLDTGNTKTRDQILKKAEEKSSAIAYNQFRAFNRSEQEEFIKGKKVIYIYHDTIDAIGDKRKTERNTFNACEEAITDLTGLTKTLSNIGVVNVFITSDHGFQYEREEIREYNKLNLENEYSILGKRYGLSKNLYEEKGCLTLELGNYNGVFPKKLQRIKSSGNGLQFVHGGLSLQEVVVPLIKFKSGANAKKSSKVRIAIKKDMEKITSNITGFSLYQLDAVDVNNKVLERVVQVALYDMNDRKISDEIKLRINETKENTISRFNLTLSGVNDEKVILKVIDIESGDILDTTEYRVNLSITADFEF